MPPGAFGADRFDSRGIHGKQRLRRGIRPGIHQREHRFDPLRVGKREEHPAAFLAPLEHTGISEDLEVARNSRLALPQHLRELTDRKLHQPEKGGNAQPCRIGECLKTIG